ncbi:MAG TPA: AraC family transcriptional regulator [Planctomycetota bacterium]|nr:AraC family transcriptional regulator [Planctomycetota bacterium]
MNRALPKAINISRLHPPADWSMAAHAHDNHEMVFVVAGEVETVMAGRTSIAKPGMIKFHPRGVPHAERALNGGVCELLCMAWSEGEGIDTSGWPQVAADRTGRIRELMEWMIELSPPHDIASALTRDALLQAVGFAFAGAGRGPLDELVLAVRAWVREHIDQSIYLDDLARVGAMSRFHFNRVFGRAAGMPPMRFVREMRVDAARSLLLNTALPLREIAPRVGFSDEFQLSRVFRQVTGQSPASLRRRR